MISLIYIPSRNAMIRREPQECTSRLIYIFYQKPPRLFPLLGPVSRYTLLCTHKYTGVFTQIHRPYLHKYISVFSHGCGSPVPGYINNGLATHDEREMRRHISSYCGRNCANIPNMRLHIRAERMCACARAREFGWWWRGGFVGGSIRTGRSRCSIECGNHSCDDKFMPGCRMIVVVIVVLESAT